MMLARSAHGSNVNPDRCSQTVRTSSAILGLYCPFLPSAPAAAAEAEVQRVTDEWAEYTFDPVLAFQYPDIHNVDNPNLAAFLAALERCQTCRRRANLDPTAREQLVAATRSLAQSWDTLENSAKATGLGKLSEPARSTVERSAALLRKGLDPAATPAERSSYTAKAYELIAPVVADPGHTHWVWRGISRLAGQAPGQRRQLGCLRGEAFLADVERHDRVRVGEDHLGAGVDEVGVGLSHPLRSFGQCQRRPLRLTEGCAHAHQLPAHSAVDDRHASVHRTSLRRPEY